MTAEVWRPRTHCVTMATKWRPDWSFRVENMIRVRWKKVAACQLTRNIKEDSGLICVCEGCLVNEPNELFSHAVKFVWTDNKFCLVTARIRRHETASLVLADHSIPFKQIGIQYKHLMYEIRRRPFILIFTWWINNFYEHQVHWKLHTTRRTFFARNSWEVSLKTRLCLAGRELRRWLSCKAEDNLSRGRKPQRTCDDIMISKKWKDSLSCFALSAPEEMHSKLNKWPTTIRPNCLCMVS